MALGMTAQTAVQREAEQVLATEGREALLGYARVAFEAAVRNAAFGSGRDFEIEVERVVRCQGLYLGKGSFWRARRRLKVAYATLKGKPYPRP